MTTNSTDSAPVSDEELDQMIWKLERDGMTPKLLSLMRELREVRKAKGEPVADVVAWHHPHHPKVTCNVRLRHFDLSPGPLYAAPPAPVVPTFDEWLEWRGNKPLGWVKDSMREAYDACRDAMLLAGNSPVTPDGWVMVPVEPTEDMIIYGFESEPNEDFSEPEVWAQYEAMSGCQQAAHRAKLCWAAMISAAPSDIKTAPALDLSTENTGSPSSINL